MKHRLLLVDFDARIAGVEDVISTGIHHWIHSTTDFAKPGEFRTVSDTLADCTAGKAVHGYGPKKRCCQEGWNPQEFHGGSLSNAVIGPLAVIEAAFRHVLDESSIGRVIEVNGAEFVVRPCRANLMPLRLWERHRLPSRRGARREEPFGHVEARRLCFAHRDDPKPPRVYFCKGTTSVDPPTEAVARIGGSESSTVVFVDKFAKPIAAYRASGDWSNHYAEEVLVPDRLDWRRLRSLGKSTRDIMFGVHG